MGSNQFQREYIEYLQKVNTDLLNKLNNMKENYECKILTKDWNRNYLISTFEEVLNICTVVPQEIDIFFEKISAAMSAFKNILLRKSEMLQVMEKISKALNSTVNFNSDLMSIDDSNFIKTQFSESRLGKKAGTAKVSPMINGHIISTEPRIHLNRMPEMLTPNKRGKAHQLSPIIEASPDTSSEKLNLGSHIFKEVKIPLERINPHKKLYNYISEESPKSRFKGPKAWKESLSYRKSQNTERNAVFLENSDSTNKKCSTKNGELPQIENIDPKEGPSWLYQENSEINPSRRYMDYKRRKHRFATVFESDEDCLSCCTKRSKKSIKGDDSEFHKSCGEADEEEELEEIRKRVIESSDEFVCDSYSSEPEENNSPLKKRCRRTKRGNRRPSYKNDIKEFDTDFEKRTLTPYSKVKRQKSTSNYSVSSDSSDVENEGNSMPRHITDRKFPKKSPVKLLHKRISGEGSFEKTLSRTECGEREWTNKRSKDSKQNPVEKNSLENEMFVELEDCMVDKKNSSRLSKKGNEMEQARLKKKSKSSSPVVILQENAGRVKRKAAPTFKLVEPKLGTLPSKSPQRPQSGSGGSQNRPQGGSGGGQNRPQNRPELPQRQSESEDERKEHILHFLFDRPAEPVFLPKGDSKAVFDLPTNYLTEEFRPAREGLLNRIKDEVGENIPVREITLPDITPILQLGRREHFSLFIPKHRKLAGRLIDIFMGMRSVDDFVSAAVFARDRVNPYLFIYALSVAIIHRPDTRGVQLPPLYENFPEKYMDGGVFKRAREVSNVLDTSQRVPIEIPRDYSASDIDPEHKVAYFREDLGVNLHHWHWHLVYPFDADVRLVNKDRRGELFYYMHQQIISRFNFERLCNGLARVERLTNFRDPIPEGYFSKLDSLVSSRTWPPRHSNAILSDVSREIDQIKFDLSDLDRWRDRLLDAIAQGAIIDENGRRVELDEASGIDVLGNLIEASVISRNRNYYGDWHNFCHLAIAICHDPDARHLETFGVMGDTATAMRDPIFYRLHSYVDYIFQQHKETLPPYSEQVLDYTGVKITGLEVITDGRNRNELSTFWEQNDVDLSRGMDFTPRGNVFARFTHLQHLEFVYRINVENNTGQPRNGTVRIFLAPKLDERGLPWLFNDQRHLFIELDKFPVNLKNRQNTIERRSSDSSVTIPFESTFRNLDRGRPSGGLRLERFNFCGCGWPQHMLIPRGSPEGFPCVLFAMVSNIEGDRVEGVNVSGERGRDDASSYCGVRDSKYPDRRNMGFPFDRLARNNVDTISEFLTPNMATTDIRIFFQDKVIERNVSNKLPQSGGKRP